MKERIQKIIAGAGITSRRKAEEMILEGRVRVNKSVVTALGTKADPQTDRIEVDGRLDYDAEGVLLLTNDGDFSNKLIHPSFSVPKKYLVKIKDIPDEKDLKKLEKGVYLPDGKTLPAKARFIRKTEENSWIEITVTEGRNRLIKRMCMAVGHPVSKLQRIEFAGMGLGNLKIGEWRYLTEKEVERVLGKGGRLTMYYY